MISNKRHWLDFLSRGRAAPTLATEPAPPPARIDEPPPPAAAADPPHSVFAEQDACVLEPPSGQAAIDLVPSWTSLFPAEAGVVAGSAALFDDSRCAWAIARLGGVSGKSVLELGPLEGGHSYMLEKAGAQEVVAIEANRLCFVKCLIAKELLRLQRVQFLLGNFTPWLDASTRRFDAVWAAGVLYHMDDPIRLLRQIGRTTDRVYIWTHFVPDEGYHADEPWGGTILRVEERDVGDRTVKHYIKSYSGLGALPIFCGGVYTSASWLERREIFAELKLLGYGRVEATQEVRDHPNGPCISIVAARD